MYLVSGHLTLFVTQPRRIELFFGQKLIHGGLNKISTKGTDVSFGSNLDLKLLQFLASWNMESHGIGILEPNLHNL